MSPRIKFITIACLLCSASWPLSAALWSEEGSAARGAVEGRVYRADAAELRRLLALAPHEARGDRGQVIELPLPGGSLSRYSIVESPMMEAGLAARYPHLKTYRLIGVDDPLASGRAMLGNGSFSAIVHTAAGRLMIDPLDDKDGGIRVSSGYRRLQTPAGVALREPLQRGRRDAAATAALPAARIGGSVIRYRLAVAATDNYVDAVGGTVAQAQEEIVNTINRVNSIYERDLGIRLVLVANNDLLIEQKDADGNDTGCLINNDPFVLLPQNQRWIDQILGSGRYDVGHVFTTDPGGLASLDSVCVDGIKGQGTSGYGTPGGDPFYIDIVAHEIGHQLGADHSFNGTTGACESNRNESTAFEPGSGSTIMSYAGLCGGENLQLFSDATFHAGSIAQIDAVTSSSGSCYTTAATGNSDPQLTGAADFTIPALTPFVLDNPTASDADADMLSYQWDQMNTGGETSLTTFGRDNGDNALFRAYPPRPDSHRNFPALGTQLDGWYDEAEVLPCSDRTLEFRLTARDNAGGQVTDDVTINVVQGVGPFEVSSVTVNAGTVDVAWDPANTHLDPIFCSDVDIDLLVFSDASFTTYSVFNLGTTANDGSATVPLPNTTDDAAVARIRVKCSNNVFYDINDANLVVDGSGVTPFDDDDLTTYFNDNAFDTLTPNPPLCGAPRPAVPPVALAGEGLVDPFAPSPSPRLAAAGCNFPKGLDDGKGDSSSLSPGWMLALLLAVFGVGAVRRRTAS